MKGEKTEERDLKRRSTNTSVEVGEASQAYERQMRENLVQELSHAREALRDREGRIGRQNYTLRSTITFDKLLYYIPYQKATI